MRREGLATQESFLPICFRIATSADTISLIYFCSNTFVACQMFLSLAASQHPLLAHAAPSPRGLQQSQHSIGVVTLTASWSLSSNVKYLLYQV